MTSRSKRLVFRRAVREEFQEDLDIVFLFDRFSLAELVMEHKGAFPRDGVSLAG